MHLSFFFFLFVHDGPNFHLNITSQLYKCFEALFSIGIFFFLVSHFLFLLVNLSFSLFLLFLHGIQ